MTFGRGTFRCALPFAATALLGCGLVHAQQDTSAAKKCKPKDDACKAAQSAPADAAPSQSLHDQFPFPVDDSKRGSDTDGSAPSPAKQPGNGMPEMPTSGVPDPPADSEKPMNLPPGTSSAADSSSSSSSGSSSSSSDDDSDVAPTAAPSNAPVKAAPLKNLGARDSDEVIHARLDKTRVPDDLKVGRYYLDTGNAQGAYLRFKDAVDHDPDSPDAHFFLAESASRLNHRDEAVANYQQYLKLDEGGDHDKDARRALKKMGVTAN